MWREQKERTERFLMEKEGEKDRSPAAYTPAKISIMEDELRELERTRETMLLFASSGMYYTFYLYHSKRGEIYEVCFSRQEVINVRKVEVRDYEMYIR
jgi:hypothetical protein